MKNFLSNFWLYLAKLIHRKVLTGGKKRHRIIGSQKSGGRMRHLSEPELAIVAELRTVGVLQNVNGNALPQEKGVILVTCADGDHFDDIFRTQAALQSDQRSNGQSRVHTFGWHGGGIRLAPNSVTNGPWWRRWVTRHVLLHEVREAVPLKGIYTIALTGHAPCGKACACNLGLVEVLQQLLQAKRDVKARLNGHGRLTVALFFHVAYPPCEGSDEPRRRTYFVEPKKLDEWLRSRP